MLTIALTGVLAGVQTGILTRVLAGVKNGILTGVLPESWTGVTGNYCLKR